MFYKWSSLVMTLKAFNQINPHLHIYANVNLKELFMKVVSHEYLLATVFFNSTSTKETNPIYLEHLFSTICSS